MKTLNNKLPALLNLPVAWAEDDWAKPLVVRKPALNHNTQTLSPRSRVAHPCLRRSHRRAFTLIELLVVISIIGILAALIIPSVAIVQRKAKIRVAHAEMNNIAAAFAAYQAAYTLAPAPKSLGGAIDLSKDYSFSETNSDVIVILMDVDQFANANHARNPEKHALLNAGTLKENTSSPGVSRIDYNYRDPWGNPYIIAMDLNYDNKVSLDGNAATSNPDPIYSPYPYQNIPRSVIIWSKGPDRKAGTANDNKDNVKNWE